MDIVRDVCKEKRFHQWYLQKLKIGSDPTTPKIKAWKVSEQWRLPSSKPTEKESHRELRKNVKKKQKNKQLKNQS